MAMKHRFSPAARAGLALIVIGAAGFGISNWWLRTRRWVPLDAPVSLAVGRSRTPQFQINVEGDYEFWVEVIPEFDVEGGPCEAGVRCPGALRIGWSVYKDGRKLQQANNDRRSRVLGGFHATPGRYQLELEVQDDGSRMNAGAPHLVVSENGRTYAEVDVRGFWTQLLLLALTGAGAAAMARSMIERGGEHPGSIVAGAPDESRTTCPDAASRLAGHHSARRPRARKPDVVILYSAASRFGLAGTITYALVWMAFVVLRALPMTSSIGLKVQLVKPGVRTVRGPGIQPLLVQITACARPAQPCYFVNYRPVSGDLLQEALRNEIVRRPPDWPVYIEAGRDLGWGSVAAAIDAVGGLKTRVILLTPRSSGPE